MRYLKIIRTWLLSLTLKLWLDENREIVKMSLEDEMRAYLFGEPEQVVRLLQKIMTAQTMWYFEAKTDEERAMAKGAALMAKLMLAAHKKADEVTEHVDDKQHLELWTTWRKSHRAD